MTWWSWMILGAVLVGWIIIQVYFVGLESFLQPLFFIVGLAEMIIGYFIHQEIKEI